MYVFVIVNIISVWQIKKIIIKKKKDFGFTRGGLGEFETVIQTTDVVEDLHNFREFSQPLECIDEAM